VESEGEGEGEGENEGEGEVGRCRVEGGGWRVKTEIFTVIKKVNFEMNIIFYLPEGTKLNPQSIHAEKRVRIEIKV